MMFWCKSFRARKTETGESEFNRMNNILAALNLIGAVLLLACAWLYTVNYAHLRRLMRRIDDIYTLTSLRAETFAESFREMRGNENDLEEE